MPLVLCQHAVQPVAVRLRQTIPACGVEGSGARKRPMSVCWPTGLILKIYQFRIRASCQSHGSIRATASPVVTSLD